MNKFIYDFCIKAIQEYAKNYFPDCERDQINDFIAMVNNSYILIRWPYSQDYMEQSWFAEEAILANDESAASYFIPLKRLISD